MIPYIQQINRVLVTVHVSWDSSDFLSHILQQKASDIENTKKINHEFERKHWCFSKSHVFSIYNLAPAYSQKSWRLIWNIDFYPLFSQGFLKPTRQSIFPHQNDSFSWLCFWPPRPLQLQGSDIKSTPGYFQDMLRTPDENMHLSPSPRNVEPRDTYVFWSVKKPFCWRGFWGAFMKLQVSLRPFF